MDSRKSILVYQYSERIKSELIIASELLAKMGTLKGEQRMGAERMMISYLGALVREIRIAQNMERSVNFVGAEKKIIEAIGRVKTAEFAEINRCISEALSMITTLCQASMEALEDKDLI